MHSDERLGHLRRAPATGPALAALAALAIQGGCLVPEPLADGLVPPGAHGPDPARGDLDDRPRARGDAEGAVAPVERGAPSTPPPPGATRLAGTVTWHRLPRDLVTIAAHRSGQDAPLARTTVATPGPFWLDVPVQAGQLTLYAWIDDSGDGLDPTDLADAPVALDLDAGPPAPLELSLGPQP